jgi:hypothetical protein
VQVTFRVASFKQHRTTTLIKVKTILWELLVRVAMQGADDAAKERISG